MNTSFITTLPPPSAVPSRTSVLTRNGLNCSVLTLPPAAEVPAPNVPVADEQILFVIEGEASVRFGNDVTTVLGQDTALHIPSRREHSIAGSSSVRTRLLRIQIPPRLIPQPEIVSLS